MAEFNVLLEAILCGKVFEVLENLGRACVVGGPVGLGLERPGVACDV